MTTLVRPLHDVCITSPSNWSPAIRAGGMSFGHERLIVVVLTGGQRARPELLFEVLVQALRIPASLARECPPRPGSPPGRKPSYPRSAPPSRTRLRSPIKDGCGNFLWRRVALRQVRVEPEVDVGAATGRFDGEVFIAVQQALIVHKL
jgi:hypothetical protein